MRWEGQRVGDSGEQVLPGLPGLVRTVRTPEFAGITFHEVAAKSVLNRVHGASRMPFGWTVNPYRGCSHACRYCLTGDTEILMADRTVRRLVDVRVGDRIFGTQGRAQRRHYVPTQVLAHWPTAKWAYRLSLVDGTALVASAEHRLLTDRGWRHVSDLDVGDQLMGTGRWPEPQVVAADPSSPGVTVSAQPRLTVHAVTPLNVELPMFDITTGTGDFVANGVVSHNCFARNSHTYLDFDAGRDFDSEIVVKVNAAEVLARQLRAPSWTREHVAMGTNTDPYQRAEGRYELMPGIIRALADSGTPFSILTKGTVLSRDLPLLIDASKRVNVGVGVSIALVDRDLQHRLEPGTASPQARLELVRRITEAGLPCGVFVAPVLPSLTDSVEQLDALLGEVAAAGATGVTVLPLHLRPGARQWFAQWLAAERPELVPTYRSVYGTRTNASPAYRQALGARVGPLLRRHGLAGRTGAQGRTVQDGWPQGSLPDGAPTGVPVAQEQLTLL